MRVSDFSGCVGKVEGGSVAPTPQGHLPSSAGGPRDEARRGDRGGLAPRVGLSRPVECQMMARLLGGEVDDLSEEIETFPRHGCRGEAGQDGRTPGAAPWWEPRGSHLLPAAHGPRSENASYDCSGNGRTESGRIPRGPAQRARRVHRNCASFGPRSEPSSALRRSDNGADAAAFL